MAQNKGFGIDFNGFLDLAEEIDQAWGGDALLNATEAALIATKDYVNSEVERAIQNSKYNFDGTGYSKGDVKASLEEVKKMGVVKEGTTLTAYAGIDMSLQAEEILYIIYGTPHMSKDSKLYNAIKVKGSVKKEVEKIQRETFLEALGGGVRNG